MIFIKVLIIVNISTTYMWFHQPKMSIIPKKSSPKENDRIYIVPRQVDFSKVKSAFLLTLGAENETRTRDPNLGKVMLYQLSYFRMFRLGLQRYEEFLNFQIFRKKFQKMLKFIQKPHSRNRVGGKRK